MMPGHFVSNEQIADKVNKAVSKLGPDVVRVRYSVREDSGGDPAIYFRIVLTDLASREETLGKVTGRIRGILREEINSYENWGLISHFSFRSESEQASLNDLDWA